MGGGQRQIFRIRRPVLRAANDLPFGFRGKFVGRRTVRGGRNRWAAELGQRGRYAVNLPHYWDPAICVSAATKAVRGWGGP